VLQKQLGFIINNKIIAIWIAAFIFSAIHLQFEGFLPRFVLGLVLGYLYYWTGNLWVTMIAHASTMVYRSFLFTLQGWIYHKWMKPEVISCNGG
jgi:membrane protease YdiL (CAAX protease family)